MKRLVMFALCATALGTALGAQQPVLTRYWVRPQDADSLLTRYLEPNYVVFDATASDSAPLLVFMPGTGGRPANTSAFTDAAARQGYRAIGLEYDDQPAVEQLCPRDPDPECSEYVRRKRIFGDDVTPLIDDRAEESIVNRLSKLLVSLDRDHPTEGWSRYLENGQPRWTRIAVAGLSQGAGMAAYIAQRTLVARVILFSSPWDQYGPRRTLAPWVRRGNGATPSDRWYGAWHEREPTASLIEHAYSALHVPGDHIRRLSLAPAGNALVPPYHPSTVANGATPRLPDGTPAYLEDWKFLLGSAR
ncbi:MAG: hypothetical protein JWO05_3626 [Gemmatimonadetes bacterium]|nr:hypothetical protein [Gemmatimonadota bacterium]